MFAEKRPAIAQHQIGGVFNERTELAHTWSSNEIEIDARVHAALSNMSVKSASISVALEKLPKIAKVTADVLGRHGRILPALPCFLFTWHACRGPETGFADLPHNVLFFRIVVEFHWRHGITPTQILHETLGFRVCFFFRLAAKLHQQPTATVRQQPK